MTRPCGCIACSLRAGWFSGFAWSCEHTHAHTTRGQLVSVGDAMACVMAWEVSAGPQPGGCAPRAIAQHPRLQPT